MSSQSHDVTDRKNDTTIKRSKEIANLSRNLFVIVSLLIGLLIMGIAILISQNPNVRDPGITNWLGAISVEVLIAVGTSIVASIVFYATYSRVAEERVLREISETATEYAMSLFTNRFDQMLPSKIFPESALPTEEYDRCFTQLFRASNSYKYKGDIASFNSFRLICLTDNNHHLEKDILLLLLDPLDRKLFEERAKVELAKEKSTYSKDEVLSKMEELITEVFVTLTSLFDNSHRLTLEVAFHKELLFFRSEILDDAIFVSYYLGKGFPDTYLYSRSTLAYESYILNFRQNSTVSTKRIVFNSSLTEDVFCNMLKGLGCKQQLDELRELKKARYKRYSEMITYKAIDYSRY